MILFLLFHRAPEVTFEVREEAVGIGQSDSVAKYGIGESIGRSGEILEDDYGIAVIPDRFVDIVSGIDPGKLTGRIGDDRHRGFGVLAATTITPDTRVKSTEVGFMPWLLSLGSFLPQSIRRMSLVILCTMTSCS